MDVTTFAVDLAKRVFQVHGYTQTGERVVVRRLKRRQFLAFFERRTERCRVVMEACGGSQYWGRELERLGYTVELIAPQFVRPFVVGNKHDGNDTDAIYEASRRPRIRRVAIKSEDQQAVQAVHRVRERLKGARTALTNQLRGLLGEYGWVFAKGEAALRRGIAEVLEDARLPGPMRELLGEGYQEWCGLDERIAAQDRRLAELYRSSEPAQRLGEIEGVGVLTATAMLALLVDVHAFANGRAFAAWLGLTPREHSSGDRRRLGGITKRGDAYGRTLLVHGGRSAVQAAMRKSDPRSRWIQALVARRGRNKAAVAVANHNARIIYAMLASGEAYRPARAA